MVKFLYKCKDVLWSSTQQPEYLRRGKKLRAFKNATLTQKLSTNFFPTSLIKLDRLADPLRYSKWTGFTYMILLSFFIVFKPKLGELERNIDILATI